MKFKSFKFLFLSFLLLSFESFPQFVNNFSEFPWKSSKETVMSLMNGLNSLKLNSEGEDFIVFENGIFGSYVVNYWCYYFFEDQLYEVTIVLDSIHHNDTTAIDGLKNNLYAIHDSLTKLVPDRYKGLLFLYDVSLKNLIGIIEVNNDPYSSFGNKIRINFVYYSIFVETDILKNIKSFY